jgi:hypothetical protein
MKLSETEYLYKIGEVEYRMKPLVLGQISRLMKLLEGVVLPEDSNVLSMVSALGDKLPMAFAIIFHIPNIPLKEKNLEAIANDLEFELSPEMTMEIVEDFFDCTPISLLAEKMGKTIEKIGEKMTIGSKKSVSSSPVETSQNEI